MRFFTVKGQRAYLLIYAASHFLFLAYVFVIVSQGGFHLIILQIYFTVLCRTYELFR